MGFYFEDHLSMAAQAGLQVERTLDTIVRRYRGHNPPHLPSYRPYQRRGIMRGKDYRYVADFNAEFPDAPDGALAYAWGRIWSEGRSEIKFDVSCHCPTHVYQAGACVFQSTIFEERYPESRHRLNLTLEPGWNHLVLRFKKTRAGFGGVFGTWLGKLPYYFLMPTPERAGHEGWIFTGPLRQELAVIPGAETSEAATGVTWHPQQGWSAAEKKLGQCRRIFGLVPGGCAVGWTRAQFLRPGRGEYVLTGECRAPITVTIADEIVLSTRKPGRFEAKVRVPFGIWDVMVRAACRGQDWGYELTIKDGRAPVNLLSPCQLQGPANPWMYLGPLAADQEFELRSLRDLNKLAPGLQGDVYWRLDAPDTWVRPYNDNPLYGRWNYPLGVTLYGLLQASRLLGSGETQRYIVDHIQFCCDLFDYAMWDRQQYGGATNVHHLLTSIDSLDDCGSFGSCVLEVAKYFELHGAREISDYVADFITNHQVRLPDGTFFRKDLMHEFHEDTLWADDLYMSVPFLCRYYQLTGEARYIDDAARQFLGFKERLYLPDQKLMAHVYDFSRKMATGVPWGRGNGWVIFSLSELLAVLPSDHALRPELLAMFRELSAGYLAQQGASGMWHQVLNEHDSYPETSCTSMFVYGFARGVQYGWLEQPEPYVRAVFRAWEALNRISIDRQGNIHGVCRGSEFSFTSDYYKKDLLWNLNDTHGIGIVLLAGVEVLRLTQHLQKTESASAAVVKAPPKKSARRSSRPALGTAAK
ncbi:glycoside hydrolase family 88/105 protein [Opitutus terrae]|uniref:Glycosyl hydrolase family 88 n=1 Tax=Opitutus terrae (strain DSM 11246 / JCM 15787 / PB90-1) TaxID=452637 RepID=B1ZR77_OPITP|nr:glycoside hydrolase family 88 protein [Opitutus terrae]ACB74645.1 glycosyl hydrolase family 88 [Opitutus terrae PB90-1]